MGGDLYVFIDRANWERWQCKGPQATAVRAKSLYVYWADGCSGGKFFDDQGITTVSMIYSLGTMNVFTIFDSSLLAVEMFQPGSQCRNSIVSVALKIQTLFLRSLLLIFTSWLTQHFIVYDVIITQMWLNLHHPHIGNTATFVRSTCKKTFPSSGLPSFVTSPWLLKTKNTFSNSTLVIKTSWQPRYFPVDESQHLNQIYILRVWILH